MKLVADIQERGQIAARLGTRFAIVGTLPGAFRHCELGFVDAFVMFKTLDAPDGTRTNR